MDSDATQRFQQPGTSAAAAQSALNLVCPTVVRHFLDQDQLRSVGALDAVRKELKVRAKFAKTEVRGRYE